MKNDAYVNPMTKSDRKILTVIVTVLLLSSLIPTLALKVIGDHGTGTVPQVPGPGGDFIYHRYPDMTYELQQLAGDYPELIELTSIGESVNGLELWNVHISNLSSNVSKISMYLDGGHHGNEYLGVEFALIFINRLVEDYGVDPFTTELVDNADIYVTPMINPDGNTADTRENANSIDLNRNYPFMFQPGGSHGDYPGSEPEVAANIAFIESHNFSLYITGHTGITILLYPWGYTVERPPDHPLYLQIKDVIERDFGIETCQTAEPGCLGYQNQGTSRDYGYGALGIPTLTFEVDDEQFAPVSYQDIENRLSEEMPALMWLAFYMGEFRAKPVGKMEGVLYGDDNRFSLAYSITNNGWAPLANATVSIHSSKQMKVLGETTQTISVMPWTSTYIYFDVEMKNDGRHDIEMQLKYNLTSIENGTNATLIVVNTIHMEEETFWSSAWALVLIVVIIAMATVAIGVAYHHFKKEKPEVDQAWDDAI